MHDELKEFADKFSSYAAPANTMNDADWDNIKDKIQVVIPAGGESKRLRGITKEGFNKISTKLPNGDTLVEYNIRMYAEAGLKQFVLLIGHAADTVVDLIGNGDKFGVNIEYSRDPEKPVATGGAIRLAIDSGIIVKDKYLIVHNGGDIFFGYPGNLPREFVSHHVNFEKKGSTATILSAPMSLVQGSVLKVVDSFVENVSYEAYVPMPYHTAATMFSPSAFKLFEKLFVPGEKMEFEKTLFPYLSERKLLTAMKVPNEYFLPVKNEKQWLQLLKLFEAKK